MYIIKKLASFQIRMIFTWLWLLILCICLTSHWVVKNILGPREREFLTLFWQFLYLINLLKLNLHIMKNIHFKCPVWVLTMCNQLHPNQDIEYFQNSERLSCVPLLSFLFISCPRKPLICFLSLQISYTCLRISCKMGQTIWILLSLISFAQHNAFENHP